MVSGLTGAAGLHVQQLVMSPTNLEGGMLQFNQAIAESQLWAFERSTRYVLTSSLATSSRTASLEHGTIGLSAAAAALESGNEIE